VIEDATYSAAGRRIRARLVRTDVWQESTRDILNFPSLVELADDRLFLGVRRQQHGTKRDEPVYYLLSEDGGATWSPAPPDMGFGNGGIGYLRDGSILRLHHNTVEADAKNWKRSQGLFHNIAQQGDPTFRLRRWTAGGEPIEEIHAKVEGIPWERASYQSYAKILDLPGGDLLTALEAHVGPIEPVPLDEHGWPQRFFRNFCVSIVRSGDGGRTWQLVTTFHRDRETSIYGMLDRPVDEGFAEADVVLLPEGGLLCVMRTGCYSPLFQSRSTDGGQTWTRPESIGWPGVRPRLQSLPNGVLTCVSGRGSYGHPQTTHAIVSLDGAGAHWEYPFAFHTGPGCSYTQTMVRDGQLHVVYSHSDFTRPMGFHGLASQTINRAVIAVDDLPATA